MRIFINPVCDYGKGLSKWQRIESDLRRIYGKFSSEQILSPEQFPSQIEKALEEGERIFIAAGGDGTLHHLLNSLLRLKPFSGELTIGSVGLGSSNDFHKPFRKEKCINGISVRMDWKKAVETDLIAVGYGNGGEKLRSRLCLINASIGVTAQANDFYNSRHAFIFYMKKICHDAAVVASALKTLATYRNIPCFLTVDNGLPKKTFLSNLGVIKNPHFAGGLCYDTVIGHDDGDLGINICDDMSKVEAVRTLIRLYGKKFSGYPKTTALKAKKLRLESHCRFALEMDGEVVNATRVEFKVLPKAARCCQ